MLRSWVLLLSIFYLTQCNKKSSHVQTKRQLQASANEVTHWDYTSYKCVKYFSIVVNGTKFTFGYICLFSELPKFYFLTKIKKSILFTRTFFFTFSGILTFSRGLILNFVFP